MASVFLSAICGRIKLPHGRIQSFLIRRTIPRSTFHVQHSTFHIPRSTFHVQHSTFNIPHSTFHIPHSTLYTLSLGSCQSSRYHSAPIAVAPLTPAPTICGVCGPQRCASPFLQLPSGKGFPLAHTIVLQS